MAKQRLFPKALEDDKREPHDKFTALASKVVTVPKSEIDKREKQWQRDRDKSRK
jgi:hypothetical protein